MVLRVDSGWGICGVLRRTRLVNVGELSGYTHEPIPLVDSKESRVESWTVQCDKGKFALRPSCRVPWTGPFWLLPSMTPIS